MSSFGVITVVLLVCCAIVWGMVLGYRIPQPFSEIHMNFQDGDLATAVELTPDGELHVVTYQGRVITVPIRKQ